LRSQCAFHRELVEVAALDQKLKSLGQNSAVEFNQRLLDLMQTSKET
jgi:HPr kinase/phosphorylase